MPRFRLALAQTNPTVGDRDKNAHGILTMARKAYDQGAQLLLTGELSLTGYPIEDLALRDNFLEISEASLKSLAEALQAEGMGDMAVVVGHPSGPHTVSSAATTLHSPARATNCASVLAGGHVHATYAKHHLPTYAVFDEFRTFVPGTESLILRLGGIDAGLIICEDLWREDGPVATLTPCPLGLLIVPNASPFERDKADVRQPLVARRAQSMDTHIAYVNIVGGQDDLVFDGDSMIVTPQGTRTHSGAWFSEDLVIADLSLPASDTTSSLPPHTVLHEVPDIRQAGEQPLAVAPARVEDDLHILWAALVTGVRDYVDKNGFASVILGLSGGIDSAVCAAISVDALGPDRVFGVGMPSIHSSQHSLDDAAQLATNLGISYRVKSIKGLVEPFDTQLGLTGLAAENVQARARGVLLMALSNGEGHLVLTTGNKSELSVGYSTIYGDSVGGFAPIKDVPKTLVWELARWRNNQALTLGLIGPIPTNSIDKPPSAELRPDQKDQDSLPDYEILDEILELLVVQGLDAPQIIQQGFEPSLVDDIVSLVSRAEWKRRQGAIGTRISSVSFGRDRRLPVTNKLTSFESPE